ncbi:MAG: ATP-binding protein [Oculatellaceae cyanobacterium bins.114]|nr:ATP-binding protein [Oculatellaceae cyanobacterium bins.114]
MAMLGQSSFRRILLSRILIFSIPILLLGVAVTFRKARTSLLDTARQNLMESAIRKADTIQSSIEALQTSLAIASQTSVLQSGSSPESQSFLTQLLPQLPTDVRCLQLTDLQTNQLVASTCGTTALTSITQDTFSPTQSNNDSLKAHLLSIDTSNQEMQAEMQSQLILDMSTPVYVNGKLRYGLTAQAVVKQLESAEPWSLLGYTVVLDQDGTFLAHPVPSWLGRNISEASDSERFQNILSSASRNERATRHLFDFIGDETEWLAGFTPVEIPISATETHTWVVLAATPLDNALQGLQSITQILVILTTGLLSAHLLAMLYMARDLSLPIEQLGKYARRIHKRGPLERAPKNFKIRELNQLSGVLDNMVSRLEERARELEAAWQEAEAANQLKSEFLANTSHELRTPLNAIIGCIRLVQDGCCDTREEEKEFLEQADKAAVHLLKIINDLLDIRRIEEKGLPLSIELVDLRTIIKEVIDIQAVQIQQKGLQLTVPELLHPIMVRVDPARLKQVFLNVVYNATKFTDKGGITLKTRVETAVGSAPHNDGQNGRQDALYSESWIVISVQDTGIGIDPAQQHKLFRPFVMVDGTTTRKYEGTGLGLAISRNLVEMMGGSITLQSEGADKGTTVEIALPIVEASELSSESPVVDGTPEVSTSVSRS